MSTTFNNPSLSITNFVNSLDTVRALDHNSLKLEMNNRFGDIENTLNISNGGAGLTSNYIGKAQVTSSKLAPQVAWVAPNNPQGLAPNSIQAGGNYTTGAFGDFVIVWDPDNRFGTALFDITAVTSAMLSNPITITAGFFAWSANVEMFAIVNGNPQSCGVISFNGFDGNYDERLNFATSNNGGGQFLTLNYQPSQTLTDNLIYVNSSGQASTQFYFKATLFNNSNVATDNTNKGRAKLVRVRYNVVNQAHP
jgi:hypothetical protein